MTPAITMLSALACILLLIGLFVSMSKRPKHVSDTTPGGPYTVIITDEGVACEHSKRPRESIRWDAITEIRLATTSVGPWQPDEWYLFIGNTGGFSVPSEAKGFDQLWPEFKRRFPGIDYGAIIKAGTSDNQKTIWKRGDTVDGLPDSGH